MTLTWPANCLPRVDKHSTGGIGDKVSLPLAPLLACCDVCVPMLSGRGLGPTGGTLDKLESIPGFRTNLSLDEIYRLTQEVGCVITGTTPELVPADRQLYALRDVTATVPSVPLITASIMSKKLAENLNALVLDVKYGCGAFIKSRSSARELAAGMITVGQRMGVATTAYLTDMNQPLGRMAGNAVEVAESIDCLRGGGPNDLRELVLELGEDVLVGARVFSTRTDARAKLLRELDSGRAMERFERMISTQGGRLNAPRPIAPPNDVCGERRDHRIDRHGIARLDHHRPWRRPPTTYRSDRSQRRPRNARPHRRRSFVESTARASLRAARQVRRSGRTNSNRNYHRRRTHRPAVVDRRTPWINRHPLVGSQLPPGANQEFTNRNRPSVPRFMRRAGGLRCLRKTIRHSNELQQVV